MPGDSSTSDRWTLSSLDGSVCIFSLSHRRSTATSCIANVSGFGFHLILRTDNPQSALLRSLVLKISYNSKVGSIIFPSGVQMWEFTDVSRIIWSVKVNRSVNRNPPFVSHYHPISQAQRTNGRVTTRPSSSSSLGLSVSHHSSLHSYSDSPLRPPSSSFSSPSSSIVWVWGLSLRRRCGEWNFHVSNQV